MRNDKPISKALRVLAYKRDGYQCVLILENGSRCPRKRPLTLDHIVPRRKGGPNSLDNLQTLCEPCHRLKDNRRKNPARPPRRRAEDRGYHSRRLAQKRRYSKKSGDFRAMQRNTKFDTIKMRMQACGAIPPD